MLNYKAWLDEVIAVHKRIVELNEQGGEDANLCIGTIKDLGYINIHVFKGLRELANAVGAVLERNEDEDSNHEYYFMYDDCKVFSLEER